MSDNVKCPRHTCINYSSLNCIAKDSSLFDDYTRHPTPTPCHRHFLSFQEHITSIGKYSTYRSLARSMSAVGSLCMYAVSHIRCLSFLSDRKTWDSVILLTLPPRRLSSRRVATLLSLSTKRLASTRLARAAAPKESLWLGLYWTNLLLFEMRNLSRMAES
jgi:hypothetical protein